MMLTLAVGDLDAAVEGYRAGLGLRPGTATALPADGRLAALLPQLAGARSTVLTPPGYDGPGVLRLAEVPGIPAPAPLTTLGWAAAEYLVADVAEACTRAREAGWRLLADPGAVGSGGGLQAVQVAGPAGEAIYLTQVNEPPPGFDLPQARGPVGPIFIAVVASAALETARASIENGLGARRVTDHPLSVRALNAALGLTTGTRHRVSTVQLAGQSALEVDQYPAGTPSRLAPSYADPCAHPAANPGPGLRLAFGGIVAVTVAAAARPAAATVVPTAGGAIVDLQS
jgi:catechol 2,3-dioxygenase-like lactoylglutathione lyase family enzyme